MIALPTLTQPTLHVEEAYKQNKLIDTMSARAHELIQGHNYSQWHRTHQIRYDLFKDVAKRMRLSKHSKILDVGCALGQTSLIFETLFESKYIAYHGVDYSEGLIRRAKTLFPHHRFSVANIYSLAENLEYERYDLVLCTGVFNIIPDWTRALEQLTICSRNAICVSHLFVHTHLRYAYIRSWDNGNFQTPFYLFSFGDVLDLIQPYRIHYLKKHFYETDPELNENGSYVTPKHNNVIQMHITLQAF